ncbi:hypothetical protein BU24DRAFT_492873 [Aaosphaeria arxii CBS 175.79]|uniref:Uncharacterized protein n=1 Tax=Aaosphaeria arxii CBS 175.79 TaxID=1450172 RepID=A0A6A5XN45_9PLEO|nr:uncharacterized protein BU24DRAFT_492873 [Aaosphaeria arxii CBS 175.79]KAF2014170.1 hypothetical protein BU24DRAFT_492873 [Aaosphaeria arxii CBS 175.79]
MAVCRFVGNEDMYGLGIRLGYYLLWLSSIFGAWMAPSEVRLLRYTLNVFVAASFLALIILTVDDVNRLQPVEAYIVLLLMFGAYLALVPIYIWRILTVCDHYWNPTRWPIVPHTILESNLKLILLVGILVYQYWFWFTRVPILDRYNCEQYGFLFAQARLNSKVSVAINALLYSFLGFIALYLLWVMIRRSVGLPVGANHPKRSISHRHKVSHINLMRNMVTWFKIIVATLVVLAIELTIQWNEIRGINSLAGAGQTIPFLFGLGTVLRILYVYFSPKDDIMDDDDSDSYYSHRPRRSAPAPRPPAARSWVGSRSTVSRPRSSGSRTRPISIDRVTLPMSVRTKSR